MRPRGTAGAASRVVAMCGVGAQTAGGVCRPAATVVPVDGEVGVGGRRVDGGHG